MGMPIVRTALKGWTEQLTYNQITQSQVNYQNTEIISGTYYIKGQLVPIPKTVIDKKPIEQRSWKWWTLTIDLTYPFIQLPLGKGDPLPVSAFNFNTDDTVVDANSIQYRVRSISDQSRQGVIVYEVSEDFEVST